MRSRADHNSAGIIAAWRKLGWYVQSVGPYGLGYDAIGFKGGRVVFAEIKNPKQPPNKRKLTPNEQKVHGELAAKGIDVVMLEQIADLMQLDREARSVYEGIAPRNFYPET